jgi:hypothetical protein
MNYLVYAEGLRQGVGQLSSEPINLIDYFVYADGLRSLLGARKITFN